jgi:hypothetical protein
VIRGWPLTQDGEFKDGIAHIRQGLTDYAATGAEM